MFISTKKEYLLTDSVCIAGLNKKRIKTTENNGIGHLNTGSVPVVWILHFSMKLFWETKLEILAFVNKRRSDLPKTDQQQFDHSFLIRHDLSLMHQSKTLYMLVKKKTFSGRKKKAVYVAIHANV